MLRSESVVGRDTNGSEDEEYVEQMHNGLAVPQDNLEASKDTRAQCRIAFVEDRGQRATACESLQRVRLRHGGSFDEDDDLRPLYRRAIEVE